MSLSADNLLDRIRLKSEIVRWRSLAILIAVLFGIFIVVSKTSSNGIPAKEFIARITIDGIILEDRERSKKLYDLANNDSVKAVIMHINSPGGTMVGGETLYNSIVKISEKKPVVAVMGTVAASGGYMTAIAADYIFTQAGTITGSIGVMLQTAEITELSEKLGINFITLKSGELKGSPSPVEKLSHKARVAINSSILDSFDLFVDMIVAGRNLSKKEVMKLADGRIYTGRQAVANKLVDAVGDEYHALDWLQSEKNMDKKLKIKDIKLKTKEKWLEKLFSKTMGSDLYMSGIFHNSLMTLWNPAVL